MREEISMKKLIAVTGASSGIGAFIAKKFSEQGHPLLLLARRVEPMRALGLPDSLCLSVDVTDHKAVKAAVAQGEAQYGAVDLLVNCAGVMLFGKPESQDFSEWNTLTEVNVKGVLAGTSAVLKGMVERNTGTIINISSIAGRKTFNLYSVYCGSKAAVHAITEGMRKEVSGSNVRVIVISPGKVNTNPVSHTDGQRTVQDYSDGIMPADVADCVSYAYNQPQSVCVREIVIATTGQTD